MLNATLIISLLLLCSCNNHNDAKTTAKATEQAVADFHDKLNKADFKGIYTASHSKLKSATTEKDFVARLEAAHQKLGDVQTAEWTKDGVLIDMRPVRIEAIYKTHFTAGEATETFTLLMDGERAILSDYKIDSPTLK